MLLVLVIWHTHAAAPTIVCCLHRLASRRPPQHTRTHKKRLYNAIKINMQTVKILVSGLGLFVILYIIVGVVAFLSVAGLAQLGFSLFLWVWENIAAVLSSVSPAEVGGYAHGSRWYAEYCVRIDAIPCAIHMALSTTISSITKDNNDNTFSFRSLSNSYVHTSPCFGARIALLSRPIAAIHHLIFTISP